MSSPDLLKVFDLLARSNNHGLKLSLDNEELSIRFSRGKKIDQALLNELKSHKGHIIEYFKNRRNKLTDFGAKKCDAVSIEYDGKYYYPITPTQIYWVNDNMDREFKQTDRVHGSFLSSWYVYGKFNSEIFRKVISYLIMRHESLRTTFHHINGEYLMRVEQADSLLYNLEINDLRHKSVSDQEIEDLADFEDHKFNFEEGPLFRSRLILIENEECIVSLKLHHVIMDGWSHEILVRDLIATYNAFCENRRPGLPALKYQFKEFLGFINNYIRENYDAHKKYWNSLYDSLPDSLIIPGVKKSGSPLKEKICKIETFQIPIKLANDFAVLSKEFSASIFVIIQATFKAFLHHKTGQTDIVIGTYVFGREYPGMEDQIGCYAKTVLIRTIFCKTDSFREILKKVIKSNEDTRSFAAYTLIDTFRSKLSDEGDLFGSFWKINLQYTNGYRSSPEENQSVKTLFEKASIQFTPRSKQQHSHIPIDMYVYFFHSEIDFNLVIYYDSSLYDAPTVREFAADYLSYASAIVKV